MYGRVTRFQGDPSRMAEMESRIPDIKAQISKIEGGIANYAMWNNDGSGVAVAIYPDEATANAAQTHIQKIWGGLADLLTAAPEITSYSRAEQMRN